MSDAAPTWTDVAEKFANTVGGIANVALKIDRGIEGVDNVLGPFAAFIPYYSQAIAVAKIADPILSDIATYAPAASQVIETGRPIIDATQAATPAILAEVKKYFATALSNSPVSAASISAEQISDLAALKFAGRMFAGREWTQDELQRWWDKAQGEPQ